MFAAVGANVGRMYAAMYRKMAAVRARRGIDIAETIAYGRGAHEFWTSVRILYESVGLSLFPIVSGPQNATDNGTTGSIYRGTRDTKARKRCLNNCFSLVLVGRGVGVWRRRRPHASPVSVYGFLNCFFTI